MNLRDLWLRLRALFLRRRVEEELDEELQFHLEMQARKNRARGAGEDDARRKALLKFGNPGNVAEECRDQRGIVLVDSVLHDLNYALRQLRVTPFFTLVGVLSLALGIGANTALFTVFDTLYLRKLAVPQPDELVSFQWRASGNANPLAPKSVYGSLMGSEDPDGTAFVKSTSFSSRVFDAFRISKNVPAELIAFASLQASAEIDGWPRDVSAQVVSGDFFRVLGVKAIAGRFLEASDDDPAAEPAAVVSQHAWETLFGSDSSVIGKRININGFPATIIGVAPGSLQLGRGTFPDFSLPMAFAGTLSQGRLVRPELWWLEVMARRKAGATLEQVQASLQGILEGTVTSQVDSAQAIAREQIPQLIAAPGSRGFVQIYTGGSEAFLLTVSTVFALLLLIVCLNLANLLTARGVSREYEIAMRLALGASRLRLIRQLLTESLILALIGGAAGIVLSLWGKEVLRAYFGPQVPLSLSWRILAFNIAVASLTGLLFGLAPALRATRSSLSDTAKQKAGNPTQSKRLLNKSLIVIQVAMSVVLLIGAGLLIQSAGNWSRLDMGFDPTRILLFDAPPPQEDRKGADLYSLIAEQIRGIPGVLGTSTAGCFPPSSCSNGVRSIGGERLYRADARYMVVNPGFFNAAGVPLVVGRTFTAAEATEESAVAVVDEEFARLLFPGSSPLGKRFIHETNDGEHEVEVIGVARNIVLDVGRERLRPVLYGPERPVGYRYGTTFIVRIAADPERIVPLIRRAVSDVDPRYPIFGVTTFKQLAERNLSQHRQLSTTWTFFGGSVLLLTAIGLYGLMAYTVSRRVNEIGIRIALGATRLNVVSLVMNQILRLIVIGLGVGFVMSLGLNQVIRAYIFGIQLFDLRTLIAVASLVAVVTLAASFLPARRSARIDPVIALRSE